jgi:hypothetical protein
MKVVYINDEQKEIMVRVNDRAFYDALNSGGDLSSFDVTMKSCEIRVFELDAPDGAVPYIKKWKNVLMISYIDPAGLAQLPQWPQPQVDA